MGESTQRVPVKVSGFQRTHPRLLEIRHGRLRTSKIVLLVRGSSHVDTIFPLPNLRPTEEWFGTSTPERRERSPTGRCGKEEARVEFPAREVGSERIHVVDRRSLGGPVVGISLSMSEDFCSRWVHVKRGSPRVLSPSSVIPGPDYGSGFYSCPRPLRHSTV